MLKDIISTHVSGNIFLLGKKEILFTVEDVGIILGFPNFRHPVRHYGSTKKKSRLYERFGMATNFDRKKVHSLIQQLVKSDDEADVEDTVRLWIVLLLCTFLAPRSVHSCPQQMLSCLDDIQRIREYNCAAVVQEVWFLEHTRVRQPINRMTYPRFFRWGTFPDETSPFPIASLTGQLVIKNLTVERNEMETIYEGNQIVPKDTSTATTVRRMLTEYGAFPDAAKWELHFDSQCPQQASGSLNYAIYSIFCQNGEPKPVSHFTSTDEIGPCVVGT
ncbi:hypothetical protein Taro_041389 [Colocasia esculenta]|uniref:Uncharacterized protein n=1 Tax=Colocasia esculenta TaxID=4460 RepID=A0A843WPQ1_COLES|nr:hypothetical protein [Colocasia esculenta]